MSGRAKDQIALSILVVFSGIVLLSDPKCKCGCRTLAQHLVRAGFELLGGAVG